MPDTRRKPLPRLSDGDKREKRRRRQKQPKIDPKDRRKRRRLVSRVKANPRTTRMQRVPLKTPKMTPTATMAAQRRANRSKSDGSWLNRWRLTRGPWGQAKWTLTFLQHRNQRSNWPVLPSLFTMKTRLVLFSEFWIPRWRLNATLDERHPQLLLQGDWSHLKSVRSLAINTLVFSCIF